MAVRVLAILLALTSSAWSREVTYYRLGETTYGSDGSQTRRFGDGTYTTRPGGPDTRCYEFARQLHCRDIPR